MQDLQLAIGFSAFGEVWGAWYMLLVGV